MEPMYTWSRKWLQAILDVPAMCDERLAAYQAHRDRMKNLDDEVHAKYLVGAKGGEADRNFAAKFYLAEANLWVAQQSGKTGPAAGVPDKNADADRSLSNQKCRPRFATESAPNHGKRAGCAIGN